MYLLFGTLLLSQRVSHCLIHFFQILHHPTQFCTKKRPHRSFFLCTFRTSHRYKTFFPFSKPLRISPRPISICQLNVLPRLHSKPINLVVFKGSYSCDGISYLEGGFTLRCLQRLSLPDLATLPCCWYNNRYTSGPSIPVLSY